MSISRRGFLKGLCALSIAAYAPTVLTKIKVNPLPQGVTSYLDNMAKLFDVARKPGESDADLKSRILAKYIVCNGKNHEHLQS